LRSCCHGALLLTAPGTLGVDVDRRFGYECRMIKSPPATPSMLLTIPITAPANADPTRKARASVPSSARWSGDFLVTLVPGRAVKALLGIVLIASAVRVFRSR
jgi:hypothetical protein